jgi:RHS repeat-associated protein
VRKITERQAAQGQAAVRKEERIYMGGFEIYRTYQSDGASVDIERETLHVMDDKQRIAMVETRTQGSDESPGQMTRYQFTNHLGSAALELDDQAQIISYEEYYPYGCTSYSAARSQTETPKRYRYTGKERDEENGFYYHGARYYAPWLGRWTAADPAHFVDGPNLYEYVMGNPVSFADPSGHGAKEVYLGLKLESALKKHQQLANKLRKAKGYSWIVQHKKTLVGGVIPDVVKTIPGNKELKKAGYNAVLELKARHVGSKRNLLPGSRAVDIEKNLNQVKQQLVELEKVGKIKPGTKGKVLRVIHDSDKGKTSKAVLETWTKEAKEVQKEWVNAAKDPAEKALRKRVTVVTSTRDSLTKATKGVEKSLAEDALKTGGKELLETEGKTTLKEGAKVLSKKAAKFVPVVGIVVGVGLVANDLKNKDYGAAAWDTAEAIPVVGDVVGAAHIGIETGTLLNSGLGISDVAAEHGTAVENKLTSWGMSKDTAMIFGATTAGLSSITVAPQIALQRKVLSWLN